MAKSSSFDHHVTIWRYSKVPFQQQTCMGCAHHLNDNSKCSIHPRRIKCTSNGSRSIASLVWSTCSMNKPHFAHASCKHHLLELACPWTFSIYPKLPIIEQTWSECLLLEFHIESNINCIQNGSASTTQSPWWTRFFLAFLSVTWTVECNSSGSHIQYLQGTPMNSHATTPSTGTAYIKPKCYQSNPDRYG